MLSIPAPVRRLDFAILDRAFTPIANWAHDLFDVRARPLSRACLALMPIAAAMENISVPERLFHSGLVLIPLALDFFVIPAPPSVGCANIRRHLDQWWRLWILFWLVVEAFTVGLAGTLYMLGNVGWLYFGAVQERPRQRRRAAAPVMEGA